MKNTARERCAARDSNSPTRANFRDGDKDEDEDEDEERI
jgi:hypothetical protein